MPKVAEPEQTDIEKVAHAEPKINTVKVRILPKGDGKVSTGEYDMLTNSFPCHKRGAVFDLHPAIARQQEDNGYVEILSE